ncbi:MAG: recombinase family protein [Deltaproteobacteria bacterium]|nr:recombinase family protein [Deltaproteobacteria bacterium]
MGTRARKTDATLAVAYLRCSTDRQEESPGVQLAAIAAWAGANGVRVVAERADVGVSGATAGEARPGLVGAMADLKAHGAGILLVQRRDRVARDIGEAIAIDRAVEKLGARVVAVDTERRRTASARWS